MKYHAKYFEDNLRMLSLCVTTISMVFAHLSPQWHNRTKLFLILFSTWLSTPNLNENGEAVVIIATYVASIQQHLEVISLWTKTGKIWTRIPGSILPAQPLSHCNFSSLFFLICIYMNHNSLYFGLLISSFCQKKFLTKILIQFLQF